MNAFNMKYIVVLGLTFTLWSCSNQVITTPSGLRYRILEKGTGLKAQTGDELYIFETTSYRNGTVLYSNYEAERPVKILLGGNQATQAVDEGIRGMRLHEVRELIAPPYLVKRKSYPSNVSPDSTLVIKIKLHEIIRK